MVSDNIKALVEQRIIEATGKQISTKVSTIARILGKPIVRHTFFDNYLSDAWTDSKDGMVYDADFIRNMDYDEDSDDGGGNGYIFDGLKIGINLNITALIFDEKVVEIKTTYNGYLVYAEIEREIRAYAPFPAWEDAVNMFYEGAVERERSRLRTEREEQKEVRKKKFREFWKSFKMLWGY